MISDRARHELGSATLSQKCKVDLKARCAAFWALDVSSFYIFSDRSHFGSRATQVRWRRCAPLIPFAAVYLASLCLLVLRTHAEDQQRWPEG